MLSKPSRRKPVSKKPPSKKAAGAKKKAKPSRPAKAAAPSAPSVPLFRAYLAMSLDGYIADKSGGVEWLDPYFSKEIDFGGFARTIGVTIYGRGTYDWVTRHGHLPASAKNRAIILTHRPIPDPRVAVETFAGDVRTLATRLRHELFGTGKDIWLMGGGLSIAPFHEAGLVDRWELAIMPVLLGDGIPLFPKHSRPFEGLRLTHSRALKNGIVEVRYEPEGRPSQP